MNLYRHKLLSQIVYSSGMNMTPHISSCEYKGGRWFSKNSALFSTKNVEEPLMDLHGRKHDYLRISLTERCNLRCQYCMPAEGVQLSAKSQLLSRSELTRFVRLFAAIGVNKLRLTGGEPTVRSDLTDIIREMASTAGIGTVAMTSNGVALARRLPALQRAGLTALNVSLDSLRADRYERLARRPGLQKVLACIDLALQLDLRPVKVNTVLMKGINDDEIFDFVEFTKDRDVEVRFIEFMPFSGNRWDDARMVPGAAALAALRARLPALRPLASPRCGTATLWQAAGHRGRVGFISSMSEPFCGGCNRLRLTADGSLKVCLFGGAELSLRDAARAGASDGDLAALVRAALRRKLPQHAAARAGARGAAAGVRGATAGAWARVGARGAVAATARGYCTLTHLDAQGRARMVDVGGKPVSRRTARAECYVQVSAPLLRLLRAAGLPKGDALTVAQVAGALAAKRAADLLPLCHPLALDAARVAVRLPAAAGGGGGGGRVRVQCEVRVTARTGAEMEALTGCAVAALALYDMCKAVDRHMVVGGLRVVSKTGGARGDWSLDGDGDRDRDRDGPPEEAET